MSNAPCLLRITNVLRAEQRCGAMEQKVRKTFIYNELGTQISEHVAEQTAHHAPSPRSLERGRRGQTRSAQAAAS